MSHFCLLRDPQSYTAREWDLVVDTEARTYWLDLFHEQVGATCDAASACYGRTAGGRVAKFRQSMETALDRLRTEPPGKLGVIDLDRLLADELRKHKIDDPYLRVKQQANEIAIKGFEPLLIRLDDMEPDARWLELVRCVFAGNSFDLGAPGVAWKAAPPDFAAALAQVPQRPWLVDHFDALAAKLPVGKQADWSKAVIMVDNGGADFVLGVMPLARELALAGVRIVLAANRHASLNDITADEAAATVERLAPMDQDLADLIRGGMFEVVSTGSDLPVIDLSAVPDELNEASQGADLLIVEGMGRGIETNRTAAFTCDALRICMLKNPSVAARLGGKASDVVCQYTC